MLAVLRMSELVVNIEFTKIDCSSKAKTTPTSSFYERQQMIGLVNNSIKVTLGHYVDLINPDPNTIDITSIATALSRICRFGGHCPVWYSVAEHCIHAADIAFRTTNDMQIVKAVLMHDATEAYLGDMVKPLKVTQPKYQSLELRMQRAIAARFNINFDAYENYIEAVDLLMLKAERMEMWPDDPTEWTGLSKVSEVPIPFEFMTPKRARNEFIDRALSLGMGV